MDYVCKDFKISKETPKNREKVFVAYADAFKKKKSQKGENQ